MEGGNNKSKEMSWADTSTRDPISQNSEKWDPAKAIQGKIFIGRLYFNILYI